MTYEEVLDLSRASLNDVGVGVYDNTVLLPYLNMSLMELQELFEQSNVPVTFKTSATINVPAGSFGITEIGFSTSPALPEDLIEIQEVWQSQEGQNNWVPVQRKNYLTQDILSNTQISYIAVWAWIDQKLCVLTPNTDNDLKLDYIKYLFPQLTVDDLSDDLTVLNAASFLQYRTAALAAANVMEDAERANGLNTNASLALDRVLSISAKGQQGIYIRRRPFRAAYKRRGILV